MVSRRPDDHGPERSRTDDLGVPLRRREADAGPDAAPEWRAGGVRHSLIDLPLSFPLASTRTCGFVDSRRFRARPIPANVAPRSARSSLSKAPFPAVLQALPSLAGAETRSTSTSPAVASRLVFGLSRQTIRAPLAASRLSERMPARAVSQAGDRRLYVLEPQADGGEQRCYRSSRCIAPAAMTPKATA
jgi:hypothetical protein